MDGNAKRKPDGADLTQRSLILRRNSEALMSHIKDLCEESRELRQYAASMRLSIKATLARRPKS